MVRPVALLFALLMLALPFPAYSVQGADTLSLAPGWNFVSFPKSPPAGALEAVQNVQIVWGYDNENQVWKKYKPGAGSANTLTALETDKGYWIYVNPGTTIDATSWASVPTAFPPYLYRGWNLLGYNGTEGAAVNDALQTVSGKWTIAWNWTGGTWYGKHVTITTLPSPIQSLAAFSQWKAFWVLMNDAGGPPPPAVGIWDSGLWDQTLWGG